MAFLPLNDLKSFDNETLTKEIVATKKQLFELRLKKATRQSFKPHAVLSIQNDLCVFGNLNQGTIICKHRQCFELVAIDDGGRAMNSLAVHR